MSFGSPHDTKEQIRQSIDIVDLVGSYIPLRRQGGGYVGLCPWHDDSRPSLQVNPQRQSWKCWVCEVGGDIFSFLMQREGVDFREALTMLAERAGVSLAVQRRQPQAPPGSPADKRTLYQALQWAEQQFHECLLRSSEAEPARQYLEQRGITRASIERFHLGFSPQGWQWILERARATAYSPAVLEAAGLVGQSQNGGKLYDRFRGRVLFPIRDPQNRPIAFGGRVLPQWAQQTPAKYINSPETRLFSKSEQLYGLDVARDAVTKSRQVVVVEGYTDVVVANQCGVDNVVAVLGTALGPRHITLLRRFADTVILVLDGDEAGRRRTNEILELFVAAQADLRILTLPEGLDPCDFLLQQGPEAFRQLQQAAVNALEHKIRVTTEGVDTATDVHQAHQALEEILATLAKAPGWLTHTTEAHRLREQQILARLAREFHLEESQLRMRLSELRRGSRRSRPDGGGGEQPQTGRAVSEMRPTERELLEIFTQHPELAGGVLQQVPIDQLSPGPARLIYLAYLQLVQADQPLEFTRVLTELEDPGLKSILVELDERAQQKAQHAQEEAATRIQGLLEDLQRRRIALERREKLAALEARRFDEKEECDVFLQLLAQERNRQGISAPMDG